jgi:hypothetical protein
MVDKPSMSTCVNVDDYEKQVKHWQALKIEQLEAENKRLKDNEKKHLSMIENGLGFEDLERGIGDI